MTERTIARRIPLPEPGADGRRAGYQPVLAAALEVFRQLGAADVHLSDDVLDAIDAIVPPGTNLNAADAGWRPPHLDDPASRRR